MVKGGGGKANKAKVSTADVQRLMACQYTAKLALMAKLLIASIDFVSSRGCTEIDN